MDIVVQQTALYRYRNQQVVEITQELSPVRFGLEKEIVSGLLLIQGMANHISIHPTFTQKEFALYAENALRISPVLKNIGAAPDFIMAYMYPRAGNEKMLGVNYRSLPKQWPQVQLAWLSGGIIVAGPLDLVQGGSGLIGRTPVFVRQNDKENVEGEDSFWGIVSAVIDMDRLFESVNINALSGLKIAIRGIDGKGAEGEVFWGRESLFDPTGDPVLVDVFFPSGSWQIAALPVGGWPEESPYSLSIHLFMGGLLLIGLFLSYKDIRHRIEIQNVKEKLGEAQAFAHLGSWEQDLRRKTLWWSDEVYNIFGVSKDDFVPSEQGFLQKVHPNDLVRVKEAYRQSAKGENAFSLKYRILRPDGGVRFVQGQGKHLRNEKGEPTRFLGTIHDITEQREIVNALESEQAKLQAMAEATYDPYIMIDSQDTILFWSPAAEKVFGWTNEEALGQKMHELITPPEYIEPALEGLHHFAQSGKGPVLDSISELPAIRKNGEYFPVERSVSAFQVGDSYYAVGVLRDITERKKAEEKLAQLASTDELTGLFNRRTFIEMTEYELKHSKRSGSPISLVMLDADKFKNINDTYGHAFGDEVLQVLASTVLSCVREVDILGRVGGEEFLLMLPDTPLEGAVGAAERIRAAIEQVELQHESGETIRFTVSMGISVCNHGEESFDDLFNRADMAMYQAKQKGRNRVETA